MSRFALVALLPEPADDKTRMDFVSREFETAEEIGAAVAQLEFVYPKWRALTICHTEDLPLLMEEPKPPSA